MKSDSLVDHTIEELMAAQKAGDLVALAVVVKAKGSVPRHAGAKMLIYADGRTSGTIGGGELEDLVVQEAKASFEDNQPRFIPYSLVEPQRGDPGVCGGEVEVYVEPFSSPPTVLIVGCGHVGRSVAQLASWLGFRVAANDDREEMATPEIVPDADVYLPGPLGEALDLFEVTNNTYVVTVTRNITVDRQVLPMLLETPAPYIGIIGSQRRWEEAKKLLVDGGVTEEQLERFHSPIGLELSAETPEEIALSIMAEIVMLRRGGTGNRMAVTAEKMAR